jgi:hypothetical protein
MWETMRDLVNRRRTIAFVVWLTVLCTDVVLSRPAWIGQQHYELVGPCEDQPSWNEWKEIRDAEAAGDWDRAVALRKESVKAGCSIQYRRYSLVKTLLRTHRPAEASSILQQMDSRGLEVNPALMIDAEFPEIGQFMESKEFAASPLGLKIKRLEQISDERRIKFQEVLNTMPASEKPPENYVAKDVCPFECCRYGNWTVLENTDLVTRPGGTHVIGSARKGSHAVGLTGEVHLRPKPVVVLTGGDPPKNSIAFVLDYIGEGYGHVYTRGKVVEKFLGYAKYCFQPSESCWGETLFSPTEARKQVWWVKARLANDVVGWTDKTDNFGDKDACA